MPRLSTQAPRPRLPTIPTADTPLTPSTSQRTRDAHTLQALGLQLVALSATQLARFDLPEALHEAVVAAQRMRAHGARTRQLGRGPLSCGAFPPPANWGKSPHCSTCMRGFRHGLPRRAQWRHTR
jgi:Protein of unknown function (DUF615)